MTGLDTLLDHSISTCRRSSLCRVPCRWSNRARFLHSRELLQQQNQGKLPRAMSCQSCSIGSKSSGTSLHQAVPATSDRGIEVLCRQIQQRCQLAAPAARAARHCWWSLPPATVPNLNSSGDQVAAASCNATSGSYILQCNSGFRHQQQQEAATVLASTACLTASSHR